MTRTPRRPISQLLSLAALAILLVVATAAEAMQQRPARQTAGELLPGGASSAREAGRMRTRIDYRVQSAGEIVALPVRGRFDESLAESSKEGPQQIGVHRELPNPYRRRLTGADLAWVTVPGGRVASIVVRSADARAMRLAITPQRLPVGAEVAFFDADTNALAWGPYDMPTLSEPSRVARDDNSRKRPQSARESGREPSGSVAFWSPVIEGEAVGIEIFVPEGTADRDIVFALPRISHMVVSPYDTRSLSDIGGSGACEVDVACDPNWSQTALAAAKEIFDTNQGTFLCTGQLLSNTRKDGRPYYSTANHCIDSQAVAVTATFFWFFERVTCGGAVPTTVTQTSGGGDLLDTSSIDSGYDFTLMQLRRSPPRGTALAGWSNSAPRSGDDIVGIHHPAGDLKKISTGTVTGFDVWGNQSPNNSHVEVRWSDGVTEGGSSGSGLYRDGRWPNQPLIGVLSGGSSFCSAPTAPDVYGRIDRFFPDIARWLDPSTVSDLVEGGQVSTSLDQGEWIVQRRRVRSGGAVRRRRPVCPRGHRPIGRPVRLPILGVRHDNRRVHDQRRQRQDLLRWRLRLQGFGIHPPRRRGRRSRCRPCGAGRRCRSGRIFIGHRHQLAGSLQQRDGIQSEPPARRRQLERADYRRRGCDDVLRQRPRLGDRVLLRGRRLERRRRFARIRHHLRNHQRTGSCTGSPGERQRHLDLDLRHQRGLGRRL